MFPVSTVKRSIDECNRQFAICEYCHWCATLFVYSASEDTLNDDSFEICPMCNSKDNISIIPLQKNEAYRISFEDKRGLDIQFLKIKRRSQDI
ncbi:MAG: hypothetical protein WB988_03375 [Candidatus Nitrosopolaris sp.]